MATSPWRLQLDRAVRYAVSDALAAVKSHAYDLEYTHRRPTQEVTTWANYLADLRTLHQLLLNLPNLETAQWLTDERITNAPTFTPFINNIKDAKTNVRRVHSWLVSLPQTAEGTSLLEQTHYRHQVAQVLTKLEALPAPGSDAWVTKYKPAVVEKTMPTQQPLVRAVA